jgi:hypothetical protein
MVEESSAMSQPKRSFLSLGMIVGLLLLSSSSAWADGGTIRFRGKVNNHEVTVFTAPVPFRSGPVDVSVLVQDARTGVHVSEARVQVELRSQVSGTVLKSPATPEAATNKLFHAAVFQLPEPGWWDVEVTIDGPQGSDQVGFAVRAEEPLTRWLELWPWFGWPALVVALFGLHKLLVQRKRDTRTVSEQG